MNPTALMLERSGMNTESGKFNDLSLHKIAEVMIKVHGII
jgi:hypothetical protein